MDHQNSEATVETDQDSHLLLPAGRSNRLSPLQIRPAQAAEFNRLITLQTQSLRQLSQGYYTRPQIRSLEQSQAQARSLQTEVILVAVLDDHLVGFVALMQSPRAGLISGLYVHPDWARRGIGRRLVEAIEQTAIAAGAQWLTVTASLTAVEFYRRQGYTLRQRTGFWSGGQVWIPCRCLRKRLGSKPTTQWSWWQVLGLGLVLGAIVLWVVQMR